MVSEKKPRISGKSLQEIAEMKGITINDLARKGGSVKSEAKTRGLQTKFLFHDYIKPKKCGSKCPLFPCWAEPESVKNNGMCGLKQFPKMIKKRTIELYLEGEEGFNKQMIEILTRFGNKSELENSAESLRSMLHEIMNVKNSIYGGKQRIEQKVEGRAIPYEDIITAFNEIKKEKKEE